MNTRWVAIAAVMALVASASSGCGFRGDSLVVLQGVVSEFDGGVPVDSVAVWVGEGLVGYTNATGAYGVLLGFSIRISAIVRFSKNGYHDEEFVFPDETDQDRTQKTSFRRNVRMKKQS